jgi:predicted DNA-binding transcriptional regulator AlpA
VPRPDYYTAPETFAIVGIGRTKGYQMLGSGEFSRQTGLTPLRWGVRWRFLADAVDAYVERHAGSEAAG